MTTEAIGYRLRAAYEWIATEGHALPTEAAEGHLREWFSLEDDELAQALAVHRGAGGTSPAEDTSADRIAPDLKRLAHTYAFEDPDVFSDLLARLGVDDHTRITLGELAACSRGENGAGNGFASAHHHDRKEWAAWLLAADVTACEALLRGEPVPRSRIKAEALAALGEPTGGDDLFELTDELALRADLRLSAVAEPEAETKPGSTWQPVDLVALSLAPPEPPALGALLYLGRRHVLSGETESLKTWLALILAVTAIRAGHTVVFVDFGEGGRRDIYARLRDLGLTDDEIRARFVYLEPDEPATTDAARADIEHIIAARQPSLVIFDAGTGALELHGLDPNSGRDVQAFYRTVVGAFRAGGAAIVVIDHLTRNRDARGRYAIGSERKVAVTDVHLKLETVVPFGRGRVGLAKIETLKDRPGYLPRPRCAELQLASDRASGRVTWKLTLADHEQGEQTFLPTVLMERVSIYVERCAEPPSRNILEKGVTGNRDSVRLAIDTLAAEGYIAEGEGLRGARIYTSQRPYRQAQDTTSPDLAPTSPGAKSNATSPTSPRPLQGGRSGMGEVEEDDEGDLAQEVERLAGLGEELGL